MARLVILFLLALPALAVECTTVSVTAKSLTQRGNALVSTATISFVGDTITETKEFVIRNGQAEVLDIAFKACAAMTNNAGITIGVIVPTEIVATPKEQAILDITEAARQLCALENYAALVGLAGTSNVAGTTMNLNGRRTVLTDVFAANATTWNQVKNRMLDEWPNCGISRDVAVTLP